MLRSEGSVTHHANTSPTRVTLFLHQTSTSILNNPSSANIKYSGKALVGLFVFMGGSVNYLLSAFDVHPYDIQAWLSTCVIICHPWFLYTETAQHKSLRPRPAGRRTAWLQYCGRDVNVAISFCVTRCATKFRFHTWRHGGITVCVCLFWHSYSVKLGKVSSWIRFPN